MVFTRLAVLLLLALSMPWTMAEADVPVAEPLAAEACRPWDINMPDPQQPIQETIILDPDGCFRRIICDFVSGSCAIIFGIVWDALGVVWDAVDIAEECLLHNPVLHCLQGTERVRLVSSP